MRRRWSFWMAPVDHDGLRFLEDLYRGRLTLAGRGVLWAAVASSVLLIAGIMPLRVWSAAFFTSVLVAAWIAGLPFRPKVSLTRRLPPPPSAGDSWGYDVIVENLSKRTLRDLFVQERGLPADLRPVGDAPEIPVLDPGERVTVRLVVRCRDRGAYILGKLEASTILPSGLVKTPRRATARDRVLVYPKFTRMEDFDVPVGRVHQPGGIPVASQVGESAEFSGVRDWRDGDRPRDVHWPSFARSGRLVVRETQEEYFVRLALVLDIEARTAKDEAIFERGLSVAASIADALARKEHVIDIFCAGDSVFRFQAGRALAHVENILELLACLEPGMRLNAEALEAAIVPEAPRLSAVIFVMTDWDETRQRVVQRIRERGVIVRVVCVRPGVEPVGLSVEERVVA